MLQKRNIHSSHFICHAHTRQALVKSDDHARRTKPAVRQARSQKDLGIQMQLEEAYSARAQRSMEGECVGRACVSRSPACYLVFGACQSVSKLQYSELCLLLRRFLPLVIAEDRPARPGISKFRCVRIYTCVVIALHCRAYQSAVCLAVSSVSNSSSAREFSDKEHTA